MSSFLLKIFSPALRQAARIYTAKTRKFLYEDISIVVHPGVFHPGLFFSTKLLLDFVEKLDLNDKSFLELGAGSGIISLLAAKKNAIVYASDINKAAIKNIRENSQLNNSEINIIQSDLFDEIKQQVFDFIIINPPFFNKEPRTEAEYAWNCGKKFEYFYKLFKSLSNYMSIKSSVFMILSETSKIDTIKSIGTEHGFQWKLVLRKRIWSEENYIFKIQENKLLQDRKC